MDSGIFEFLMARSIPQEILDELKTSQLIATTILDRKCQTLSVPETMTLDEAIKVLQHKLAEEEAMIEISEFVEAFPFDAAHALTLVMHDMFGFSGQTSTTVETMFGPKTYKPQFVSVQIAPDAHVQVPWGTFVLPGIEGKITTGFAGKDGRAIFSLNAKVKGRHRDVVTKIAAAVREKLKTDSIYRGKAIKVAFRNRDGEKIEFDPSITPEFMKLDGEENPIFTKMTEDQIELSILNPIRHTERLKENGIKIKRTVLLSGDFGTGKTLQALKTARECHDHNWTFLYVANCEDLDLAMKMAEHYAPAVVFAEDSDRIMGGDRDADMDSLSYVLDGVDTKSKEIMVVLTTNNISAIQKLMLRPGRIDAVIQIEKPDADTVYRLMEHYGKGRLKGTKKDFTSAIKPLVGQNAAFIAEAVNKAELKSIGRGGKVEIEPQDIEVAVALMQTHVDLMNVGNDEPSMQVPLTDLMVSTRNNNGHKELVVAGGPADEAQETDEDDDD